MRFNNKLTKVLDDEMEINEFWDKTYLLRQKDTENDDYLLIAAIFENWPILLNA